MGYEKISQLNTNVAADKKEIAEDNSEKFFYFIKDPTKQPNVKAEAYLAGDLDTGEIILVKNKDQKFPIASISKLMTAIVSGDILNKEKIAKISEKVLATYGENGNLHLNEKIKIGDLIYPLLLESSNDAAEALAEQAGRDIFIEKMNEKSKDLELFSTSFSDPSGLSQNNQSTVFDLFKFAKNLKLNNPDLLQITTKKSFNNKVHTWFNNSQFLNFQEYIGGKRGFTNESKQTALSIFSIPISESGTRNIGIIVLRSPDRYKDVSNILSYLKKNVYYGREIDADMAWVKQKEGMGETEPTFVTLLFGGDIMLDRGVKNSVLKNFEGDYSLLFENLDLLKNADIVFANLEGPASDQGQDKHNLYSFRMDPSVIPALKGAGFDVLSVANNHAGDWGRNAYADTLARLKENEISYVGGGINESEAEQPIIMEKYGIKIGYLGFGDNGPNNLKVSDSQAGLLLASNPRFEEIIQNASKQVDYLIVSFHFGEEYQTKHNDRQEYLAHKAIDNGAKIVIGTHPHVVQDTEVYRNGFIAYSLGNFIFDQYFSKETMQGMLLKIKLNKGGAMTIKKNTVSLNKVFQPEKIIEGKEESVKFQEFEKIKQ